MATGKDLIDLAIRLGTNPYWLGYAIATGAANPDEARRRDDGPSKFDKWDEALWKQQARAEGIFDPDLCGIQPGAQARHLDLIATELGDKLDAVIAAHAEAVS